MVRGPVYSAKSSTGSYWCGDLGWVKCRVCALRMTRVEAHRIAHKYGATASTVVIIKSPSSHAIVSQPSGEGK